MSARSLVGGNVYDASRNSEDELDEDDFDELWGHQVKRSGRALDYFLHSGSEEEAEFDKESLLTASMVLSMIAWSSGSHCCRSPFLRHDIRPHSHGCCHCSITEVHVAAFFMRFLLCSCLWLQWWLLDALNAARFKFPALDGVPYLCTYGQDTGGTSAPPRGPNGIVYGKDRGNIESSYLQVMMRNGLAKVLEKLNMPNNEIGPVEYGMESATCRVMCVAILSMWILKTLFNEMDMFNFFWRVPKLLTHASRAPEPMDFKKYCSCGDESHFWQRCNVVLPPIAFIFFLAAEAKYCLHITIFDEFDTMHQNMLKTIMRLVFVNLFMEMCFAIPAPGAPYSWICVENQTENCVRYWENAMSMLDVSKQMQTKPWEVVRSNFKNGLWSLLGKKDVDKVKFAPNSLPYHSFWCEFLPFFSARLFVLFATAKNGILVLLNTGSIMELILNALAFTFLLELEKLMYKSFSHKHVRNVMRNLQPFPKDPLLQCLLADQESGNNSCPCRLFFEAFGCTTVHIGNERHPLCQVPLFRRGDTLQSVQMSLFGTIGRIEVDYPDNGTESLCTSTNVKCRFATNFCYLPILKVGLPLMQQIGHGRWLILTSRGVAYRRTKNMNDQLNDGPEYGQVVDGVDEGDGWVRCTHPAMLDMVGSVAEFHKKYKFEMRTSEAEWEVWASETWDVEEKHRPTGQCCSCGGLFGDTEGCCQPRKKCCTCPVMFLMHTSPFLLFVLLVYLIHVVYLIVFCENERMQFPFAAPKDIQNPYFDGDNRLLGGWMIVLGNWISKRVITNTGDVTCTPFKASLAGDVLRNASGCGITLDP